MYTTYLLKSSLFLPFRYLWVNDYKGKGISGCDHYIFCPSLMLGTVCTAKFPQTRICIILRRKILPCKPKIALIYVFATSML